MGFSLSGKMVEKILVIKANMDKIQLAPSGEPDPDNYDENENEEHSDLEDVEDKIIWILNRFFKEICSKNKNFYVKILFLKIPDFSRFPVPVKNLVPVPGPGFFGPGNSRSRFFSNFPVPRNPILIK